MKRYFLVAVTTDGSDLSTLETSLKKLVQSFIECKDAKHRHPILFTETVYISIVNCFKAHTDSEVNWREVLVENTDDELAVLQHDTQWNGDDLADYIHSLADQLPNFGSFLLDVMWVIVGEDAPSPENDLGLYGAFKRLQSWHQARFTICHHQGQLFSTHPAVNTCDWVEILNAQTVSIHHLGSTVTRPGTVWTGQLCWWDYQNSEMKQFGSFRVISVKNNSAEGLQNADNDIIQEKHMCFSDNLMLLSVCCLQSVPLYLFSSHRFELSARTEVARDFLQLFNKCASNRCAILRLSYRCDGVSNPVEENSFSKEKWRMQIALGVIQYPQWNPIGDVKYVDFLFANDTMYQLRGPLELNALAYHKLAIIPTIDDTEIIPNMDTDMIFNTIPHFNGHQLHQIDKLLTADKCNTPNEVIPGLETAYFANEALELIKNKDLETSERSTIIIEDKHRKADDLNPSDLSNLAETRSLRFRSSMTESLCRYKSSDTLGGFAPPVLPFKSPITTVKDLLLCFTKKGEARNIPINKASVFGNEKVLRIGSNDQQSAVVQWPLCKLSLYHDVYYNKGSDSEKLEQKSGKMREQFLSIDTLSSRDEFIPRDNCTDRNNVTRNKPLRRSPRKRKLETPLQQTPKRMKIDNKDVGAVSDIVKPTKENQPRENVKSTKESTKCRDSEDLLKRKLRVAVVEALESKGIDLDHPLFKSCGRRLFTICQSFSKDVVGKGKTSVHLKRIADSHVGPVVEFYQQLKRHSPGYKSKPN